jgi:hypothetical protein
MLQVNSVFAKVQIGPYRHASWDNTWNDAINLELDVDSEAAIMAQPIDKADLRELNCTGYNNVSDQESKKDFWIVFFSSLVRAESAFNANVKSVGSKGGHGNYGLLQLSKRTAREQCGMSNSHDVGTPDEQLRCGVKLMSWQLKGAPSKNGKLLRPDLRGQLFGKHILLWGPLRQNDRRGRKLLVNWFKSHLDQLPFCKA